MITRSLSTIRRVAFYSVRPRLFREALYRKFGPKQTLIPPSPQGGLLADCAFRIGGGFGDHLLAARYIRDLRSKVGDFKYDIFSSRPAIAEWVFKKLPGFQSCYEERYSWSLSQGRYSVRIAVTDFVVCDEVAPTLDKFSPSVRSLLSVVKYMEAYRHEIRNLESFIQNHPFMSGFLAQTAWTLGYKRHNFGHAMSGLEYSENPLPLEDDVEVREKFGLPSGPYITVADGYDYSFHASRSSVKSTKSYPHYEELIRALKVQIPNIFIVQIGKDVGTPMDGADVVLLNKTSMSELASVLRSSHLHIDNEGGLVHLANAVGTRSCVIFGPTSADYFGYDENINVRPIFCGNCYWVDDKWMSSCPRNFSEPRCLTEQPAANVANIVLPILQDIFEQS